MGRPRKTLEQQQGNLTVEQQLQKQQEEENIILGKEQLKEPPKWLENKLARAEFKRIVKEFEKLSIVGNLDVNNIACYCNAYAAYRQATKQLSDEQLVIEKPMPNGSKAKVENPLIKIQSTYADEMRKFAALCGLTIDSRLKAGTIKTTKVSEEIDNEFGGI